MSNPGSKHDLGNASDNGDNSDHEEEVKLEECYFGDAFVSNEDGNQTQNALERINGVDIVCLYFSAKWCPPCTHFTEKLVEFYKEANIDELNPQIEIIYCSRDKDSDDQQDHLKEMPWISYPFNHERILEFKTKFKIQ